MGKLKDLRAFIGIEETNNFLFWKAVIAEYIGTLFLVFVACGSCQPMSSVVQIALSFGLIVATMAQVSSIVIYI